MQSRIQRYMQGNLKEVTRLRSRIAISHILIQEVVTWASSHCQEIVNNTAIVFHGIMGSLNF